MEERLFTTTIDSDEAKRIINSLIELYKKGNILEKQLAAQTPIPTGSSVIVPRQTPTRSASIDIASITVGAKKETFEQLKERLFTTLDSDESKRIGDLMKELYKKKMLYKAIQEEIKRKTVY